MEKVKGQQFGRTKIESNERTGSHSKRAMKGNIQTIKRVCPKCGHKKAIEVTNTRSFNFGRVKCSKCRNIIIKRI